MAINTRHVFLSHIFEDNAALEKFKNLLAPKGYQVKDSSIHDGNRNNAKNDEYIKYQILAPRINWASALVVLISPDTHKSDYVNWEIEYAAKLGKPVIGVWCLGASSADVPEKLAELGDAVVGWRADRIIDALEGRLTIWEQPDGTERPKQDVVRIRCQ